FPYTTLFRSNQRRRRPAPLLDARRDRRDLRISVGPCIFRVRDQPIDRPPLDLIGRPRPLISVADSRAVARPPRQGKCWRSHHPRGFGTVAPREELIDTPKPGSQPNATDDLRSLPLPEVEKKLGLIA